jgi:hypothetical protein
MKNYLKGCFIVAFLAIGLSACKDDYLDKVPLSGPSDQTFFSNQDELILAVNGIYSALAFHPTDDMPFLTTIDAATDIGWDRNTSGLQSLAKGNQDSNNDYARSYWTNFYRVIGRCNFILDNAEKARSSTSPEIYMRSIAEARFARAFAYHNLIELFGGVPLVTKTLALNEAQLPRNTKEEVLAFVLTELDAAAADLPASYGANDLGRATKGAAMAIKARAALYAAQAAQEVMASNLYSLHNNFAELFSYNGRNSKEIILSLQYLRTANKTHAVTRNLLSRNGQGTSNKVPAQALIDAYECLDGRPINESPLYNAARPYENRDPRLGYTVALPGSNFFNFQFETHKDSLKCFNYNSTPPSRIDNQDAINAFATFTGYCWRKYVDLIDRADVARSELNIILIRYAEVQLIYAEAKIEKGENDQSVYDAINSIRQRPGVNMPPIPSGLSQAELRSIVRKERLYELAMEGNRLFDIRRWKIAEQAMNGPFYGRVPRGFLATAPTVDANGIVHYENVPNRADLRVVETRQFNAGRDYLWPIPNIEIVTNPNLVQNPGY